MSEKQELPVDNSLRSDNSTGSPKGHTRNLKFFYSSSEVTRTTPSPAPKGSSIILVSKMEKALPAANRFFKSINRFRRARVDFQLFSSLTSVLSKQENRNYIESLSERRKMPDRRLRKGLVKLKVLNSSLRTFGGIV